MSFKKLTTFEEISNIGFTKHQGETVRGLFEDFPFKPLDGFQQFRATEEYGKVGESYFWRVVFRGGQEGSHFQDMELIKIVESIKVLKMGMVPEAVDAFADLYESLLIEEDPNDFRDTCQKLMAILRKNREALFWVEESPSLAKVRKNFLKLIEPKDEASESTTSGTTSERTMTTERSVSPGPSRSLPGQRNVVQDETEVSKAKEENVPKTDSLNLAVDVIKQFKKQICLKEGQWNLLMSEEIVIILGTIIKVPIDAKGNPIVTKSQAEIVKKMKETYTSLFVNGKWSPPSSITSKNDKGEEITIITNFPPHLSEDLISTALFKFPTGPFEMTYLFHDRLIHDSIYSKVAEASRVRFRQELMAGIGLFWLTVESRQGAADSSQTGVKINSEGRLLKKGTDVRNNSDLISFENVLTGHTNGITLSGRVQKAVRTNTGVGINLANLLTNCLRKVSTSSQSEIKFAQNGIDTALSGIRAKMNDDQFQMAKFVAEQKSKEKIVRVFQPLLSSLHVFWPKVDLAIIPHPYFIEDFRKTDDLFDLNNINYLNGISVNAWLVPALTSEEALNQWVVMAMTSSLYSSLDLIRLFVPSAKTRQEFGGKMGQKGNYTATLRFSKYNGKSRHFVRGSASNGVFQLTPVDSFLPVQKDYRSVIGQPIGSTFTSKKRGKNFIADFEASLYTEATVHAARNNFFGSNLGSLPEYVASGSGGYFGQYADKTKKDEMERLFKGLSENSVKLAIPRGQESDEEEE